MNYRCKTCKKLDTTKCPVELATDDHCAERISELCGLVCHSDFQNQRENVLEHVDEILKHEWANATNLDNPHRDDRHMVISRIRNTIAIYRKELRQEGKDGEQG